MDNSVAAKGRVYERNKQYRRLIYNCRIHFNEARTACLSRIILDCDCIHFMHWTLIVGWVVGVIPVQHLPLSITHFSLATSKRGVNGNRMANLSREPYLLPNPTTVIYLGKKNFGGVGGFHVTTIPISCFPYFHFYSLILGGLPIWYNFQ